MIKDFLLFRKFIKNFHKIDLTDSEKIKLEAYDKDLMRKIIEHSLDSLAREMLSENITRDYLLGYKQGLYHLLSYFKTYKK